MALVTVRTRRDAAAVIRAAREDAGLSQGELAERLPLSRDDTVDLESGRGSLYATRLLRTLHERGVTATLTDGEGDARLWPLHDRLVATVEPDRRNRTRVTLDVDAAHDADVLLSESFTTLPGRRPPVDAVSNFLGGYVPEGRHREVMAAKRRVDKDDLFALLREFGGSIAGAVTLRPPDEPATYRPRCEPLDDGAVSARLRQALDASDQAIGDDSRSTLPGDQPKVLVARMDGQWLYPPRTSPLDAPPQAPGAFEAQPTRRRALQPPADPAPRTLERRE